MSKPDMTHAPTQVDASKVAIMGGSVRCLSAYVWGAFAETAAAHAVYIGGEESDAAVPLKAGLALAAALYVVV